jgi:Zn-dependent alcohol dehydrogenase
MKRNRAAVLNEPQQRFTVETLDLAPPRAGEVLVKVAVGAVRLMVSLLA